MRQILIGKTTLMKMISDYLEDNDYKNIFFFDLEKEDHLRLCNLGVEEIITYTKARTSDDKKKKIIFIDEIQYLDNPSSFLKIFYDHFKDEFKLFVSGFSSLSIKSKFKDSLVGRIIDLEIYGLSFKEFLNFKNLNYNLLIESSLADKELKSLYREFVLYGSYPQVVLADNPEMKELYLKNIIDKYIYKDIKDIAKIRDLEKFNRLIKFLASQSGQLLNINELSVTAGISRPTLEEYLFILNNTYIIQLVKPFYKNVRSELTKMPKIFFEDTGILNLMKNKKLSNEIDGQIFENSIYCYFRKKINYSDIHFWRTTAKQEVDFILDINPLRGIEVKMQYNPRQSKNLIAFGNQYERSDLNIVTLEKMEDKRKINQIYPWEIEKMFI